MAQINEQRTQIDPELMGRLQGWIGEPQPYTLRGRCASMAKTMANAFPELEVRKGYFHSTVWGLEQHWWCRHRETGAIVDPTGRQFPDGCAFPSNDAQYEDLTDLTEGEIFDIVPTGVCAFCGDPTFQHETFCSPACERDCIEDLNRSLGRRVGCVSA